MKNKRFSFKQIQIDKAMTTVVIFTAVAVAIFIFSVVASKALLSQRSYQAKIIGLKEAARDQLKENIEARDSLVDSYQQFLDAPANIIGGNPAGSGQNDGDNARIILDALPSKYDFPALTTSLEKMISQSSESIRIDSINGVDDEIAQAGAIIENPVPIEIPFQVSVSGNYKDIQSLINGFERSIRPVNITGLSLSGGDEALRLEVAAKTYYQPEKKVNIRLEEVK